MSNPINHLTVLQHMLNHSNYNPINMLSSLTFNWNNIPLFVMTLIYTLESIHKLSQESRQTADTSERAARWTVNRV